MDRPTFVTISDRDGFVGAFSSLQKAQEALRQFAGVPFICTEWPRVTPDPATADAAASSADSAAATAELVWVLPYIANNAVACASTRKSVVKAVQDVLLPLELVPPDDVEYWEAEIGSVVGPAARRLALATAAPDDEQARADEEAHARFLTLNGLADGQEDSKPARDEPARINILESVVPCAFDPADEASPADLT